MKSLFFNRFRLLGIPLLSLILTGLFLLDNPYGMENENGIWYFLKLYFYQFLYTFTIWVGCELIIFQLERRFPWQHNWGLRLVLQMLLILVYSAIANIGICRLINRINGVEIISNADVISGLIVCWITTVIMNLLIAGIYFFRQWKNTLLETEVLKKEQIRTQYELLKSQVNPHFLFNALNTLGSLIDENPGKAGEFVTHMADVYRYVLAARDSDLVTVGEEVKAMESYVFLQKMRFEEHLQVHIDIPEHVRVNKIIPMSLQLLMENAIKHNEISRQNPLQIRVEAVEKGIVVRNAVRRKLSVPGTGMGLQNLHLRHEAQGTGLLPVVTESDGEFTVFVPFIASI
ncbi:MAG: histidine kinase [Bacteroidetes bacterium]|nr:histidine kinase [Bacteroidota bacterium]